MNNFQDLHAPRSASWVSQFIVTVIWSFLAIASAVATAQDSTNVQQTEPADDASKADSNHHYQFRTRPGFQVELVYSVPRETQGSWVALAVDPRGRLIASDQAGGLYRVTPDRPVKVEPIDLPVGHAHGLLYAFDSLYAVVAENKYEGPGLYRIRDRNGDDQFDEVKLVRRLEGTGEHGPHAVILAPDGKSLYVCAGNKTRLPGGKLSSRVPQHWGEDDLLPRIWGPIGSEAGTPAPGGWIARTDPDGESWEVLAIGLRNPFDAAFNSKGELFTADADAEFDLNTSWYQPTRVFHVVSGADFGWRSGTGKWPPYFADTLPPAVELGPGSPTGVTFGLGTRFPPKYQAALYVCDWSYGRVFAVHLSQQGASYVGQAEEFLSGTPLPITDLVVNPHDGAVYFTLGGRGTTSGLYRLQFTDEADTPAREKDEASISALRRRLEAWHQADVSEDAINLAWQQLDNDDRFVRHAARLVLEHAAPSRWQERALVEPRPVARMNAILGLARAGEKSLLPKMLSSLGQLKWEEFERDRRLMLVRCCEVALQRMSTAELVGMNRESYQPTLRQFETAFPSGDSLVDAELCKLLVYLQSERVTGVAVDLLQKAATREEQLRLALPLRHQKAGWSDELRREYFTWLRGAANWPGGVSMSKYIETIGHDSLATVAPDERSIYTQLLKTESKPVANETPARALVRQWSLSDLAPITSADLAGRNLQRGRQLFAAVRCFDCHRISSDGGVLGPDLTAVRKRLQLLDLLEAILTPNKVISDQFAATTIVTHDGKTMTGRIVNIMREQITIQTDMLQPAKLVGIPRSEIADMRTASISLMPSGLLDILNKDEILDLLAFLLRDH